MEETKDSNGNVLQDGDFVRVIKDLKVGGTSVTLKRGKDKIKVQLIMDDPKNVEARVPKIKGTIILKTEFLKKEKN